MQFLPVFRNVVKLNLLLCILLSEEHFITDTKNRTQQLCLFFAVVKPNEDETAFPTVFAKKCLKNLKTIIYLIFESYHGTCIYLHQAGMADMTANLFTVCLPQLSPRPGSRNLICTKGEGRWERGGGGEWARNRLPLSHHKN